MQLKKSLAQASSVTIKTDGATIKNTGDSYIQCSYHGPLGVYSVCVGGGGAGIYKSVSGDIINTCSVVLGGGGGGVVYLQLLSSIGVYC